MSNTLLRDAIRQNLRSYGLAGATVALGVAAAPALAQQTPPTDQKGQSLETIVVTGSNIRRVDIETANPVTTIDRQVIQQSGKLTLGDLVQDLPAMAGAAMNPNVNNGGGAGAAAISLRGLGSQRSLLLINGHRIPFQLQDLNMIPISAVERIEVLTEGASTVYGSDAVAGVVNVITRSNYQGAEFGLDYGISDRDDGERKGVHALFGQSTDKGNIILGFNYNKQDAVSAANRAYSHDALYRYNTGYVAHSGSSRTPTGAISLPSSVIGQFNCPASSGGRLTLANGGAGTSLSDFRCYNPKQDAFNYQAVGNYDLTPSERTGLFALGNYKLTDNIEAYGEFFHNKTVSRTQIAPVPLDAQQDGIYIPADGFYNPFGVAFGIDPVTGAEQNEFKSRLTSLGNRATNFATEHDLATFGFKGGFGDSSWNWNLDYSYGHLSQQGQSVDFINYSTLASSISCTAAGAAAGTCTPVNLFNINDPNTIAAFDNAKISPFVHATYQMREYSASLNGNLFDLPAGPMQLAAGASYRKEYADNTVDPLLKTNAVNINGTFNFTCSGPGSICSSPQQGGFNVKEGYAELLIPVLKDLPFVHSLNIDLGDRYSKYSDFGSTNNWKAAIEYRPIEDLLLRGTVSKVFRAPSTTDLFQGPAADAPTAVDPCGNASVASNPACQGYTFVRTSTSQLNGIVSGSTYSNSNLGTNVHVQPERGKSYDYGFVYDPQWINGLSVNADYFRIVLNDLIVSGPGIAQTILTQCFNTGGPVCSLILRNNGGSSIGQLKYVFESPFNSGTLTTQGVDVGAAYRLPETSFGNFRFALNGTYIGEYNIDQAGFTQGLAGHFDKTFGNFARWRGLGNIDWTMGAFSIGYRVKYISRITVGYAEPGLGPSASADGAYTPDGASVYHYGAQTYHYINAGYNIEPLNTLVEVGVDNVFDKQPPILYQQNVLNANTDVNNYDTIGRFYFAKVTVKF